MPPVVSYYYLFTFMNYKLGDVVKVRNNIFPGGYYGDLFMLADMVEYRGERAIVTHVYDNGAYSISIDGGDYLWTDEMLEPTTDYRVHTPGQFNTGDILTDIENGSCIVLAKMDDVYLLSESENFDIADKWYTIMEIDNMGLKLKSGLPEDTVYMTVDEIKKQLGIKNLVIE